MTDSTRAAIEEPSLLYEKSHFSPDDVIPPTTAEFWLVNQSPHQKIHVILHKSPEPSLENQLLLDCTSNLQFTTAKLILITTEHLLKIGPVHHHRYAFTLKNGALSETATSAPAISDNAITAPPDIRRVKLSEIKFLETREIRKNVRIVKFDDRKCLYKSVSYEGEAVALSFEVSNYKILLEKGLKEWIPELVGLVYAVDDPGSGASLTRRKSNASSYGSNLARTYSNGYSSSSVIEEDQEQESISNEDPLETDDPHQPDIHYVGALFQYFSQRDLTNHYTTASINAKLSWMRQLVAAIAAFEAAGFEHWDLKCENVVIDTSIDVAEPNDEIQLSQSPPRTPLKRRMSNVRPTHENPGRIKVIDLENSKASPAWQPPDQIGIGRRRSTINVSMIYALGKTVLEIFTGKVPLEGGVEDHHLEGLPEVAQIVVRSCCEMKDGQWMTAEEVLRRMEDHNEGST